MTSKHKNPTRWECKILWIAIPKRSSWQYLIILYHWLLLWYPLILWYNFLRRKIYLSLLMEHMPWIMLLLIWLSCNLMLTFQIFINGLFHLRALVFYILVISMLILWNLWLRGTSMEKDQQGSIFGLEQETSLLICVSKKVWNIANLLVWMQ
jgi:hypothetical protein